jgi:hypothetical protein
VAIRLIRLFTGDDDQSHFSVSEIEWNKAEALGAISLSEPAQTITFEETAAGASLDWHNAPPERDHPQRPARVRDPYR